MRKVECVNMLQHLRQVLGKRWSSRCAGIHQMPGICIEGPALLISFAQTTAPLHGAKRLLYREKNHLQTVEDGLEALHTLNQVEI